ncbi:MAG: TonB-dependent receptor plug domain-containing protein, partial [Proteobacteria bacterium]|nr:TonB-dependent receptor plug domain-containing protein [Pseudomonadota bacterium]
MRQLAILGGVVSLVSAAGVARAAPRELRGVVVDEVSGLPLAGVSVFTERGEIVVTDVDGFFALTIHERDRELTVVADRHATRVVQILSGSGALRIALPAIAGAEVIEVVGKRPEETKPLSYKLTADEIRTLPGAGNDILRAAQVLPGVARIPFSFGGLVLRGTSPRDTTTYLDGIEVPIAFHFGGITSFYPSGMLADLTLTAGGFDASFGHAQGGLVTLTTREPRTDRWRVGGSIGLLDSSVQAEGPLGHGLPGGIVVGVRRNYFDVLVDPFVSDDTPLPSYWDFQLRTSFGDPRDRGRWTPMIFGSIDRLSSNAIGLTSRFIRIAAPYHRAWGGTTLHVVPWIGANLLEFTDESDDAG